MKPGREYELVGSSTPPARAWALSAAEAAERYARAFRVQPGCNVLARPVEAREQAEGFAMSAQGLKRLTAR